MDSFENLDLSKLKKKKNVNETIKILILIYILITFYLVSIIIYIYIYIFFFMQTAFVHAVDGRNTERHVPHLRHMLCLCLGLLFSAEKH